jgi:hypothetical protein
MHESALFGCCSRDVYVKTEVVKYLVNCEAMREVNFTDANGSVDNQSFVVTIIALAGVGTAERSRSSVSQDLLANRYQRNHAGAVQI